VHSRVSEVVSNYNRVWIVNDMKWKQTEKRSVVYYILYITKRKGNINIGIRANRRVNYYFSRSKVNGVKDLAEVGVFEE